ncbi:MAG: radical SAM protein, partial [Candidatus Peribacteraceae bacterium]|nr:radical SAM protein [Candidatus Peribacteraceae bacterium]
MMSLNTFCLLLSENCNFACKYCYERSGKGHSKKNMSKKVASDTLDYAFSVSEYGVSLSLFGGEPTLNPDIIDFVCTRGKEIAAEQKKKFHVSMISNGSLMNRKLYSILTKHLDVMTDMQLSIDGKKETQDLTRVRVDGSGSFDTVSDNIPYWKSLFPHVNVHGVLSHDNMGQLFENYKFFLEEWGIERLWFLPAKDERYTQEDIDLYDSEMGKIMEYIMERVRKSKDVHLIRAYQPLDKALNPDHKSPKPCGAGDSYVAVTTNGDIWPCHHLYFIDTDNSTKLGNIYDGVNPNRSRVWTEYDADDMIGCGDCDHNNCFRCPAENYENNGSPFSQMTGTHCDFMLIDLKYQKQIKEELMGMGLMKDDRN